MIRSLPSLPLAAVAVLALLPSCSDPGPREIAGRRELSGPERLIRVEKDDAKRYRTALMMGGGGQAPQAAAGGGEAGALPFVWTVPEGWTPQTGLPMRDLSFTFGESGEGECYLSRLPGAGGGLAPNVNRWRGQMGLAPMSDAEILALPKKPMFGLEGTLVDLTGTFSGMGGAAGKPDYRLLGIIVSSESGAVFVKMTGPAALVAAHQANFDAFCASLQPKS